MRSEEVPAWDKQELDLRHTDPKQVHSGFAPIGYKPRPRQRFPAIEHFRI
jgi:hypothetical protein